jgi:hypothetical protein
MTDKRRSTVNRISFPVDPATRELWARLCDAVPATEFTAADWHAGDVLQILAEADLANHNAIRNLLYAYRRGLLP